MTTTVINISTLCHDPTLKKVWERVVLSRRLDEKLFSLTKQNKGGTFHVFASGHELVGVVAALLLEKGVDWAFPYYRDRAFVLGLEPNLTDIIAATLGRASSGFSGGRMMPDHYAHQELRIPCQSSCVGSQLLQAVGLAKSIKLRKAKEVVYVSIGDGGTSQGDMHEALNFASIHALPIIFVVQDNGWAISTSKKEQTASSCFSSIASGYTGLSVAKVDGTDFVQLHSQFTNSINRAREGEGPSIVVASLPRLGPHSSSDDPQKYKDANVLQEEKSKDPLVCFREYLLNETSLTDENLEEIEQNVIQLIEEAQNQAETYPLPKTSSLEVFKHHQHVSYDFQKDSVMIDAINEALREEMASDDGVVVFGQDVAHGKGGVFGATRGLTDHFGLRCFNTPLAESTIVGVAIGMGFYGLKPVAEIQFSDYMWTGINQIINEMSSIFYRSDSTWPCPVTIRMPSGGYIQGGPYHSQSVEGYLSHCPGLKVVIPSSAKEAYVLLKQAIHDPNPVIFLEHKALYRQKVTFPQSAAIEIGKAHLIEEGDDVTVITWGLMVSYCYEVIQSLEIGVDLIDTRGTSPIEWDVLYASVKKTGKVLIVHESALTGGFGAEIATRIQRECFFALDAPIERIAAKDLPIAFAKNVESYTLPQKEEIKQALLKLASF